MNAATKHARAKLLKAREEKARLSSCAVIVALTSAGWLLATGVVWGVFWILNKIGAQP